MKIIEGPPLHNSDPRPWTKQVQERGTRNQSESLHNPILFLSRVADVAWARPLLQSITTHPQGSLPSRWGHSSSQDNIFINLWHHWSVPVTWKWLFSSRRAALWVHKQVSGCCKRERDGTLAHGLQRCSGGHGYEYEGRDDETQGWVQFKSAVQNRWNEKKRVQDIIRVWRKMSVKRKFPLASAPGRGKK